MLYQFLKFLSKVYLKIHFKKIIVSDYSKLGKSGPLILASNHPNSFLDAIILGTLFSQPVHFMVRGDVFKRGWISKFLFILRLHPIYRLSEGRENLNLNEDSFSVASQIINSGEILLIFSEGLCVNEWKLRPLKKGTARIAQMVLNNGPLQTINIQPVGINYSAFNSSQETVFIEFSDIINIQKKTDNSSAIYLNQINQKLFEELYKLVWEKNKFPPKMKDSILETITNWLLGIPGILIYIIPIKLFSKLAKRLNKAGVFYDSLQFSFGMLFMPIYTVIVAIFVCFFSIPCALLLIIAGPFFLKKAITLLN